MVQLDKSSEQDLKKCLPDMVSSLFFLCCGFFYFIGLLVPYTPMVNENTLQSKIGMVSFDRQLEIFYFISKTEKQQEICEKTWIDSNKILILLSQEQGFKIDSKIKILPSNITSSCLTVYELIAEGKTIIKIDDVKKAKYMTKTIFDIIAVIFILVGFYRVNRVLRVKRGTHKNLFNK